MFVDISSQEIDLLDGEMHLSGQLSDWSIDDLLQIMAVTKKTGSLDIEGEREGRIHFRDGTVTGAELTGAGGSFTGGDLAGVADVLYVLSLLEEGKFAVGAADGPAADGWDVEDVVADVEALKALEREVLDAGLLEASGVRLVSEIDDSVEINPDDWKVLVQLVQPLTFTYLESKLGRGEAVRVFHTLHRLGVAHAVANGEDESDWLDRLADDIAPESGDPTWMEHVQADDPEPTGVEPGVTADTPVESPEPSDPEPLEEEIRVMVETANGGAPDQGADVHGISAPASTMLTDGVYDEIRRLRSKVSDK